MTMRRKACCRERSNPGQDLVQRAAVVTEMHHTPGMPWGRGQPSSLTGTQRGGTQRSHAGIVAIGHAKALI